MAVESDTKKCIYCGGCTAVCPVNALVLHETKIECDKDRCTNCQACVWFCPVGALKIKE